MFEDILASSLFHHIAAAFQPRCGLATPPKLHYRLKMPAATNAKSSRGRYSHFESPGASHSSTSESSRFARFKAPIFISVAFAAAVGLAVGHHYMGLSLADKPVDTFSVSQAWISRFSAALAFLVKNGFDHRNRHGIRTATMAEVPAPHLQTERSRCSDQCSRDCSQLL